MKKMVKNGLIAILVVLLALCLVSGGGIDDIEWIENTNTLRIDFNDGTWVTINVETTGVSIGFTSGDGSTPVYSKMQKSLLFLKNNYKIMGF